MQLKRFSISDRRKYRWLEMIPGALIWLTFLLAIGLSFIAPLAMIIFVILFDVYWAIRVLYMGTYLILSQRRYRQALTVDWLAKVKEIKEWSNIYHLVFLPTANESEEILRQTLETLKSISYPLDKILIVLAVEEQVYQRLPPVYERLKNDYQPLFGGFYLTVHPAGIPGEVRGKGANTAWAGRQIRPLIEQRRIPDQDIIVSTLDADSNVHPQYFSCLTHAFLTNPDRWHTSYQPIPLFHNNVWDALALMRVVAGSTTFWLLGETMRPDRMLTFSSHSMPYRALLDVDYWQTDIVSEDSRIFLQCLIRYDGRYSVTPIYIPVSMDTVQASTFWLSVVNQYKQIRRWAYGSENFPYMVWNFIHNNKIRRWTRIKYVYNQLEGTYSWATAALLIMLLGWLPFHVNHPSLVHSVLAQNTPIVLRWIMTGAMVGLVISAFSSMAMMPPAPSHVRWYNRVMMVAQWLLLPVTMIIFGSIPAIEAQTRLMLGKYLGFWVTIKDRVKPPVK